MSVYIYTGEYIHKTDRNFKTSDVKVGAAKHISSREEQLSKTKGPITYRMTGAWKVECEGITSYQIENIIHSFFTPFRCDGTEWFDTTYFGGKEEFISSVSRGINSMNKIPGLSISIVDIDVKDDEVAERRTKLVTKLQKGGDVRIVDLCDVLGVDEVILTRSYKGETFDVLVTSDGKYHFDEKTYDTHNKLYNNGIVPIVKGERGHSGNSSLLPYKIKESGKLVSEIIDC